MVKPTLGSLEGGACHKERAFKCLRGLLKQEHRAEVGPIASSASSSYFGAGLHVQHILVRVYKCCDTK
jgi:hypothetical protein